MGIIVTSAGVIGYRGAEPSGRTWYNHMPAKEIRALTGQATWDEYYKFCVVRNPFDEMVSLWWFINSKQEFPYRHEDFSRIKSDFSRWCVDHAPDAVDRNKYLIDGQISMDFFSVMNFCSMAWRVFAGISDIHFDRNSSGNLKVARGL